ncbi:hypothetical protein OSL04_18900, partial [Escherichia coli]|nr:hypothetical protein [Escherichia coli]
MDWLLDVFATWLYGLKVIAITLAVIMFISGLDDFFIDVVYWVRRIKRKLSVYRRYPRMSYRELGNDSNLLIVFYVQIMPDDFVMQLHR